MERRVLPVTSGMFEAAQTLPSLLESENWLPAVVTGDQQVLGVVINFRDHFCIYIYSGMVPSSLGLRGLPSAPQRKAGLSIFVPSQVPMLCSHQNACELCTIS